MSKPKTDTEIVAAFEEAAAAALAEVQKARKALAGAVEYSGEAADRAYGMLLYAEGFAVWFEERSINPDGTLARHEGEEDDDMARHLRRGRRNMIRRMLVTPEHPFEGIAGIRQRYRREGVKRFLAATSFVAAEGEL
ncbi:hypothetical protein QFZ75_008013 [Streptomyces sp. V3I8]|uniref:hypothetical protein n=1 Tax=Streptomyces sp. V3I8 TaxID=3042279 RepID=UPI00277F7F98|nr:hypothetical protein [Streptomyces sp. V3I8]MDQ1041511.1 hypothetical protein [Streptomyces sp. V3I8]